VKIIFAGTIGRSGLGGQAWASLQYLLGFRALGHDVFYLEDCCESSWVFDWEKEEWTTELDYPAAYVQACLEPFGFQDRWIYRAAKDSRGMSLEQFMEICSQADLLILRAIPIWDWRPEYDRPARRAFIDVDPGFTQIKLANGDPKLREGLKHCDRHFTLGQRIGLPGCAIPNTDGPWLKTLPPVFLPEWPVVESPAAAFTAIMRWQGFFDVQFGGASFGQRDREFPKFLELPRRTQQKFCLAMMGTKPEDLTQHGWEVVPGEIISKTPASYWEFIQQSRAEFGVPKHGYVAMRGGWFSDRSVCYLASGRPVVVEDTGLSDWLPVGEGMLTFRDLESARVAVEQVNSDYERHRRAARALAEKIFATGRVLPDFLGTAMN
jgi:hypothetical protein